MKFGVGIIGSEGPGPCWFSRGVQLTTVACIDFFEGTGGTLFKEAKRLYIDSFFFLFFFIHDNAASYLAKKLLSINKMDFKVIRLMNCSACSSDPKLIEKLLSIPKTKVRLTVIYPETIWNALTRACTQTHTRTRMHKIKINIRKSKYN